MSSSGFVSRLAPWKLEIWPSKTNKHNVERQFFGVVRCFLVGCIVSGKIFVGLGDGEMMSAGFASVFLVSWHTRSVVLCHNFRTEALSYGPRYPEHQRAAHGVL